MMKIYIAGASKEPDRVRKAMDLVAAQPHLELTMDWLACLDAEDKPDHDLTRAERRRYAHHDLCGIDDADILWVLAPPPSLGTGAWIEFGYALGYASVVGKKITIVSGECAATSIFSACASREFTSDDAAWTEITHRCVAYAPKTLRDWQTEVHAIAVSHGWWEEHEGRELSVETISTSLCLIHSEVSEALESIRKSEPHYWCDTSGTIPKPEGLGPELADVVIRCMDLCEFLGIDLEDMIALKSMYNESRSYRHGGKAV